MELEEITGKLLCGGAVTPCRVSGGQKGTQHLLVCIGAVQGGLEAALPRLVLLERCVLSCL